MLRFRVHVTELESHVVHQPEFESKARGISVCMPLRYPFAAVILDSNSIPWPVTKEAPSSSYYST